MPTLTPTTIPDSTMGVLKSGLTRAFLGYSAEHEKQKQLEYQLNAKIDALESQAARIKDQIKGAKKQFLLLLKANDQKGMLAMRKRIGELTTQYQTVSQQLQEVSKDMPKVALRKNLAHQKRRHAEQVLQRFQKGDPIAASTINKLIKEGAVLARAGSKTVPQKKSKAIRVAQKPANPVSSPSGVVGYGAGGRPFVLTPK